MKHIWSVKNGVLTLHFHPGQTLAHQSKARFIFVLAGTQAGKTSYGPWWLWDEIRRQGPGDYLAVTSNFDLFKLKMLPMLREVFEYTFGIARYWTQDRILELADPETRQFQATKGSDPMWGRIILRSANAPAGLESATAKAAWLDECGQDTFTLETWQAVLRRLSLHQGRVLGTTTPYNTGWLKTEVFDRAERGDPDFDVIQFPSIWNPSFPREEFERAARTMSKWRFDMMYRGEFSRPAGMIYDGFSEDTHCIDPFPIPPSWPRVVGIDFGAVHTALVWIAHDRAAGRWIVYRDTLPGKHTTKQHVTFALQHNETVTAWVGGAGNEDQQRMDWCQAGVPVQKPQIANVESGIDKVASMITTKQLVVFKTCRGILDEIGTYRRKLDESGQPTEEIDRKREYHRLDALRYGCSAIAIQQFAPSRIAVGPPRPLYVAMRSGQLGLPVVRRLIAGFGE